MTTCLVAFGVAFLVSLAATVLVRYLGLKFNIVDRPDNFRKVHRNAIPRVGGIAIFVAFLAPLIPLYFFHPSKVSDLIHQNEKLFLSLLGAAVVACGMGLVDDIRNIRARWKLLFQVIAATIAYQGGFRIGSISVPFGGLIHFGYFSYPVTVFWFVGCMNAVNLLDGLDGLAAGICLFAGITLFLVSLWYKHTFCMLLVACLSGATLGFLMFNFHPASIFLGDSGSMFLGFMVGALALVGSRKAETTVAILVPIIALGIPIFDTSLAILRRWSRRLPISAGDRQHVHHVLLSMGLSHKKVVLILYLSCVILCGAAILITIERSEVTLFVLGSLAIIAFVCIRIFGGLNLTDLWNRVSGDLAQRRRTNDAKIAVEKSLAYMKSAENMQELWRMFTDSADVLEMDFASIKFYEENSAFPPFLDWFKYRDENGKATYDLDGDIWSARLRIQDDGKIIAILEVGKEVHGTYMLPDTPELLGRLREEMTAQIKRLATGQRVPVPAPHANAGSTRA